MKEILPCKDRLYIGMGCRPQWVNTLRPRQHGRHFADDTFKRIFVNENIIISAKIPLKFVPKGLINNIPALVQIMAWRRPGDKPLSEAMMVILLTHLWVARPQWVNRLRGLAARLLGPPFLIWFNFTPSMISKHTRYNVWVKLLTHS